MNMSTQGFQEINECRQYAQQLIQQTQQGSQQYQQMLQQEQQNVQMLEQMIQRERQAVQYIQHSLQGHEQAIRQCQQIIQTCNHLENELRSQTSSMVNYGQTSAITYQPIQQQHHQQMTNQTSMQHPPSPYQSSHYSQQHQ
ncbi:hypothetical protein H1D32_10260 [Anaerobacillus sp. CMMVII]|uniref:hypothetical protein n=1 Tax=Anaerobacillus sp. CMMVII TaxID=2755588 RepID=UPI0021B725DF|nr:hypothetical protein [Anaerobacillus sp. CMMVII]MCT8138103.1 hypothetical protein [Anaerobacillus sp. CMMVII]